MMPTEVATPTLVTSADGTEIACWSTGDGPPLLLVHGSTADHTRWRPLLPYLEPHFTVHTIDRRGRGASGDAQEYDVSREYADVAAVVDAIAKSAGAPVDVLGHSFGGVCVFGAAGLTPNMRRIVLYEGWPTPRPELIAMPPDVLARVEALIAEDRREEALVTFFREVVGMPEHELTRYRALPAWQARIAAAHTVAREDRVAAFDPSEAARITVPVLLLVGGDSPPAIQGDYETVAAAFPDARVSILEGQQHIAIDMVPEVFAERMTGFLRDGR